ncbi:unnamed protein product [Heligmosomoides polygyrus]|uniref:Uncharacterized protein n=1 Tax=Heligmosomoides polygyrus TaxID=6339 RepID=A0A183GA23_HELPZ|nr:unnamed protein product [Heligmosomoides polygyrus]
MLHKDEVDLRLGATAIERHQMGVTLSKCGVRDDEVMRVRTLKDSLTIIVTCSISKTALTAVTIFRSPHMSCDHDLHQAVIKTFRAYNRVSETFETITPGGPGTVAQNGLEASAYVPRLTTGPPRLLYRT